MRAAVLMLLFAALVPAPAAAYQFTCDVPTQHGWCMGEWDDNPNDQGCAAPGSDRKAQSGVGVDLYDTRIVSVDGYDWCFNDGSKRAHRDALAVFVIGVGTTRHTRDTCAGACEPGPECHLEGPFWVYQQLPCVWGGARWGYTLP